MVSSAAHLTVIADTNKPTVIIATPLANDPRVREAIGLLFDAEWVNHNFFFDRYRRSASYFAESELAANGRPAASFRMSS